MAIKVGSLRPDPLDVVEDDGNCYKHAKCWRFSRVLSDQHTSADAEALLAKPTINDTPACKRYGGIGFCFLIIAIVVVVFGRAGVAKLIFVRRSFGGQCEGFNASRGDKWLIAWLQTRRNDC